MERQHLRDREPTVYQLGPDPNLPTDRVGVAVSQKPRRSAKARRKFIYRAAETFGVPRAERGKLLRLHEEAQKARNTSLGG